MFKPGPIAINCATYIGYKKQGMWGAVAATFGVVLPAFFIILLILIFLGKLLGNKYVQAILQGLKACITGIIVATGFYMIWNSCITPLGRKPADLWPIFITVILAILFWGPRRILKKKMSPIILIVVSAVLGVVIY